MIEVYVLKNDRRIESKKFSSLFKYVDENKQNSIKRFMNSQDSQKALLSDLLVRSIIMDKLEINNKDIQFIKNEYGKPFLEKYPDFYFNLSHSGEKIVCAIDDEVIGIDVEEIKAKCIQIADKFFSKQEIADIYTKQNKQKNLYFYDLWTLKESYIKTYGKGLSIPLNSFSIRIFPCGRIELETSNDFRDCFFKQYDIDSNYKMSICSLKNKFPENIIIKDIDNLTYNFLG